MTPRLALVWELFAAQRWLAVPTFAALLLAAAVVPLLPEAARIPHVGGYVTLALIVPLVGVLANLAHGAQGRLEERPSMFPRRLLLLPVSSLTLSLTPMLCGTAVSLTVWLVIGLVILPACGVWLPLWPGFAIAAGTAWVQALCWMPFPLPWLRLAVLVLLIMTFIPAQFMPPVVAEAVLSLVTLAGYAVGLAGVRLARSGAGEAEPASIPVFSDAPTRPPFASPMAAQGWLEWRTHGLVGLLLFALGLVNVVPLMFMARRALDQEVLYQLAPWLRALVDAAGKGGALALLPLAMPAFVVLAAGPDLARYTREQARGKFPFFFLTRPFDDGQLLASKQRFGALLLAWAWGMSLLVALVFLAGHGLLADTAGHLTASFGPAWWLLLILALAAGFVLSWLWMISGLWAGFAGSMTGAVGGILATFSLPSGLWLGWGWLVALSVAVNVAPMLWVLRGWRLRAALAVTAAGAVSALLGWPLVALVLWPVPGLLAARPALERLRHS